MKWNEYTDDSEPEQQENDKGYFTSTERKEKLSPLQRIAT